MPRSPLLLPLLLAACAAPEPAREFVPPAPVAPTGPQDAPPLAEPVELPDYLVGYERVLLDLHNAERAEVGAAPLVWDTRLAADAAVYARMLARSGRFDHSPHGMRRGQGENLWMGSHERFAVPRMFRGWAQERRDFRPGRIPNVSATGRLEDVGHYTQIIWPATERVGCAIRQTPQWDYLVCRYSPAGNILGVRVP